jgi:hypothetical protein
MKYMEEYNMSVFVTEESLDFALKHIEVFGDTDIFPIPFEYLAIRHNWAELKKYLLRLDLDSYSTRPLRRTLSPKSLYGFRIATQLDPIDTIIYTAIIYEIGNQLEAARVSIAKNNVYSYRFAPDISNGRFYNNSIGYRQFIQQCQSLSDKPEYSHVVVADIADFFPRIYSHPLENMLDSATQKSDYARVIKKMLNKWNNSISYGIPVGQAASRLLAEATISDIDQSLLSENIVYCRFSDDFRIFCKDKKEAYNHLSFLANCLFRNHGLTLQPVKTKILTKTEFKRLFLTTGEMQENKSLSMKFNDILDEIGIEDCYEEFDYDELSDEDKEMIDSLNLVDILREELAKKDIDYGLTKFILGRLLQINSIEAKDIVLCQMEKLYPLFKDVICYLKGIRKIDTSTKHSIGTQLLHSLSNSFVSHLEYHKSWILSVFTEDNEWDHQGEFCKLYSKMPDRFSKRKIILAMGRANQYHWFKTNKLDLGQFPAWQKRAFLAAASCLPGDEAIHWYRSIDHSLDELEKCVVQWAKDNPFGR